MHDENDSFGTIIYCRYVVGIRHRFSQPLCGAVGEKRLTTVILN